MSEKKTISKSDTTEKIVSLSKRRGFVFQSSEIYGGLNGCYDYGPLGVELLRNIKEAWWKEMTYRENIEGLDASILMHPKVWEASGHIEHFSDPMADCKNCKSRYRIDVLFEMLSQKSKEAIYKTAVESAEVGIPVNSMEDAEKAFFANPNIFLNEIVCPSCGNKNTFTDARSFNLLFKTYIGPLEESSNIVYLRPETAQGSYVNFNNIKESSRQKLPFGIAQIGKAFRNEINTKNFLFRTREFEQMEMQFFINPNEDEKWYDYWREQRYNWFIKYGMKKEKLKMHEHEKLAHYAKAAVDIEFEFPFGWGEVEGIHNRTDFDLRKHTEYSGKKLEYFDDVTKEKFIPYVIETAIGASRSFFAFLCNAYNEEAVVKENSDGTCSSETRTVLRLHPSLAPLKAAVFPLVNRDGMQDIANNISNDLRKHFKVFYDDSGAVGRRYRRQDECGTPFCITVDSETLTDSTVTVRDRDTMVQERISKDNIVSYINSKLI
ncbi:MAG: glycine--tRNA ligase [Bacteroidota bacterium]|nr:glycine--tRNA ligase [Bacteroidota bacterium]